MELDRTFAFQFPETQAAAAASSSLHAVSPFSFLLESDRLNRLENRVQELERQVVWLLAQAPLLGVSGTGSKPFSSSPGDSSFSPPSVGVFQLCGSQDPRACYFDPVTFPRNSTNSMN